MFRIILILMIAIPALEIWGLIKAAKLIGGFETVLLVIFTGVFGAYLAKREGMRTWSQAQYELNSGYIPKKAILDGISIFAGGLLLLTPGFFTDAIGFLLIIPYSRTLIQKLVIKLLEKKIKSGSFHFYYRRD